VKIIFLQGWAWAGLGMVTGGIGHGHDHRWDWARAGTALVGWARDWAWARAGTARAGTARAGWAWVDCVRTSWVPTISTRWCDIDLVGTRDVQTPSARAQPTGAQPACARAQSRP